MTIIGGLIENKTAGENITAPAICYISSADGKVYKANATTTTNPATCLIFANAVTNGDCQVVFGPCTIDGWSTGLTVGVQAYLSASTSGAISTTAPTNKQIIGLTAEASRFYLDIKTLDQDTATGRATGQTAANTNVVSVTVGGSDATYEVSGNVLVTTSSAENFFVKVDYVDEGNTSRTFNLNVTELSGGVTSNVRFTNGAIPYSTALHHIRCKAATTIKIYTNGTFTGCVYNIDAKISLKR